MKELRNKIYKLFSGESGEVVYSGDSEGYNQDLYHIFHNALNKNCKFIVYFSDFKKSKFLLIYPNEGRDEIPAHYVLNWWQRFILKRKLYALMKKHKVDSLKSFMR